MGNDETEISSEELKSANEFYSQCVKRDTGGILRRFLPLLFVEEDLKNQELPEEQHREKIVMAFVSALQEWENEDPDHIITNGDLFWLVYIAECIGLGKLMGSGLLIWRLNHDEQAVLDNLNKMREEGEFPSSLKEGIIPLPDEENITPDQLNATYLALLLNPQKLNFPPGNEYWKILGVNNAGEWQRLGPEKILILFDRCKHIEEVLLKSLDKADKSKGMRSKDRVEYVGDFTGIDSESRETLNEIDEIETKLLYEQVCKTINDPTDQLCLAVYIEGKNATLKKAYQNNIKTCQEAGLNSPEAITMRIKRLPDRYPLLRS